MTWPSGAPTIADAPGTGTLDITASPACRNMIWASLHSVPPANRPRTSPPRPRRRNGGCAGLAADPPTTISAAALRVAAERAFAGSAKSVAPRKQIVKGLALFATRSSTGLATDGGRGLGNQHDMPGAVVGVERIDGHQGRDRTDLGLEVAPAGTDRMADAAAGARDQA